jgi:hypothetical protein
MKKWIIALGVAGSLWMIILLRLGNLSLMRITNYPGVLMAQSMEFKGIAPSPFEVLQFNIWLILISALEWIVIGMLVRTAVRRILHRA